jgi:hypothetical protein
LTDGIPPPYGNYDPAMDPYEPQPAPAPAPTPAPAPAPATADPWTTAPGDGNWQAWFLKNVQGLTPSPDSLAGLEPKLTPHGISVLRNASGIAGKIKLPNGQIVDVGRAFSSGDPSQMAWAWQTGDGGGGGMPSVNPDYLSPFTEGQPEYAYTPTEFNAPTGESILSDPSYQFRLNEGLRGLTNNRAARGLTNTGGTLRALVNYNQGAASQEYSNAWDRAFAEWGAEENNRRTAQQQTYDNLYNAWLGRRDTYYANQSNPFSKLLNAGAYGGE